jgi:hypothetical protein
MLKILKIAAEKSFAEHAAAMETVVSVLSRNERKTLLRLLKKLGKHAA